MQPARAVAAPNTSQPVQQAADADPQRGHRHACIGVGHEQQAQHHGQHATEDQQPFALDLPAHPDREHDAIDAGHQQPRCQEKHQHAGGGQRIDHRQDAEAQRSDGIQRQPAAGSTTATADQCEQADDALNDGDYTQRPRQCHRR
ncbi:hypothetical protein G6F65_012120 [Rhizopus arrhizus]|nr:hypothetical protein G6F65_012120 [Rhizopus arrhizus]